MTTLYEVKNWSDLYETNETRKRTELRWVPVPNKHDGLGYKTMMAQENAAELFAAWNLILQVASKGDKDDRGKLMRDGRPLSAGQLALITGFPADSFQRALGFFSSHESGWLLKTSIQAADDAGKAADDAGKAVLKEEKEEKEGKEKKEEKGGAKKRRDIPDRKTWLNHCKEIGLPQADADSAYDYYQANGWKQKGGNLIKDWKAAARTCLRFHNQRNQPAQTGLTEKDYASGF